MYCPIVDDALIYAYLGYDPDYLKLSVGTVLQWLALQDMFAETRFKIFDFEIIDTIAPVCQELSA
ncbi:GNAT family N-acetyltransferase [Undibacterium piscinae]|uniref:GNAT family N-acetyltransferase n=1 Tax=Undibacterium piscinae TaxID=2495591 RepID=A0A6M4A8W8_9BURK|nr:GNAT family N-acetyltransferase [Undibacterium piscinae]